MGASPFSLNFYCGFSNIQYAKYFYKIFDPWCWLKSRKVVRRSDRQGLAYHGFLSRLFRWI